ncbi:hypothetical protein G6F50_015811 [Rhizopus delemar]|uniref:NADP-dependent oxidoreductase domain-containing protein n=1 Tax=Rhizopus delemar TaxID=936053 RepID=A0A9P6XWE1_9FUNG|nr:hypothetical protein G6F50_015811 [Rhizopus delemar]
MEFYMSIPAFGVGTFRLQGQVVIDSVRNALDVGYRAIDTAQIYENEAEVGQAIAESGVAREDLQPGQAAYRLRRPDPDSLAGTGQWRDRCGIHDRAG